MKVIAKIKTDFKEKFGLPRQSGLIPELYGKIVFEKEYKSKEALRGLDGFSHVWVLWRFSGFEGEKWSKTVRPPRLGGNKRVGVFATRSPNRPNPIGMSALKLVSITDDCELIVSGIDMKDGTEIYDIKPYIKISDSIPEAVDGFAEETKEDRAEVEFLCDTSNINKDDLYVIEKILKQDPHPAYKSDPARIYGMDYKDYKIKFKACDGIITVTEINGLKQ